MKKLLSRIGTLLLWVIALPFIMVIGLIGVVAEYIDFLVECLKNPL